MRDAVAQFRDQGFRAFKIGWGPFGRRDDPALDEAIVRAAREAAGADAQLFVDAGASDAYWPQGLKWAIRTARDAGRLRGRLVRGGAQPDAIDDYVELRRQSPVPIAGGEVLTRRQTFLPWLVRGALDIVQPDVTKVGGISEQRRIAWMAEEFGVKYVGHGWNTALGVAADLQLAAALPDASWSSSSAAAPMWTACSRLPFKLDVDGYLRHSGRPGLGVALDPDKVARYTPDPAALFHPE